MRRALSGDFGMPNFICEKTKENHTKKNETLTKKENHNKKCKKQKKIKKRYGNYEQNSIQ